MAIRVSSSRPSGPQKSHVLLDNLSIHLKHEFMTENVSVKYSEYPSECDKQYSASSERFSYHIQAKRNGERHIRKFARIPGISLRGAKKDNRDLTLELTTFINIACNSFQFRPYTSVLRRDMPTVDIWHTYQNTSILKFLEITWFQNGLSEITLT